MDVRMVLALTRMSLPHRLRGEHEGVLTGSMPVKPIRGAVHVSELLCCCDSGAGEPKLVHGSRITQRQHAAGGGWLVTHWDRPFTSQTGSWAVSFSVSDEETL